jgi:predicted DNA-binding WGR domain protein
MNSLRLEIDAQPGGRKNKGYYVMEQRGSVVDISFGKIDNTGKDGLSTRTSNNDSKDAASASAWMLKNAAAKSREGWVVATPQQLKRPAKSSLEGGEEREEEDAPQVSTPPRKEKKAKTAKGAKKAQGAVMEGWTKEVGEEEEKEEEKEEEEAGGGAFSGRYFCNEGTSDKFWEIRRAGNVTTSSWGRVGQQGMSKPQVHDNAGAANAFFSKQVDSKIKKNYVLSSEEDE